MAEFTFRRAGRERKGKNGYLIIGNLIEYFCSGFLLFVRAFNGERVESAKKKLYLQVRRHDGCGKLARQLQRRGRPPEDLSGPQLEALPLAAAQLEQLSNAKPRADSTSSRRELLRPAVRHRLRRLTSASRWRPSPCAASSGALAPPAADGGLAARWSVGLRLDLLAEAKEVSASPPPSMGGQVNS